LLTLHLLGVLRTKTSTETLPIYPIAIRVLLATNFLLIIGIRHCAETLAIYPVAVGILLTFHLFRILWK
jgi:hypothetical protein